MSYKTLTFYIFFCLCVFLLLVTQAHRIMQNTSSASQTWPNPPEEPKPFFVQLQKNLSDWLLGSEWVEEQSPSCTVCTALLNQLAERSFDSFHFQPLVQFCWALRSSYWLCNAGWVFTTHQAWIEPELVHLGLMCLPASCSCMCSQQRNFFFPLLKHTNTSWYDPTLTTTVWCREGQQQKGISPGTSSLQTRWTDAASGRTAGLQQLWGNVCLWLCGR